MRPVRTLGAFEGIGGFRLGAEAEGGFEWIGSIELDPHSRQVLAYHWPGSAVWDDIRTFRGVRGCADLVVGGFPCTGTSQAGKRQGLSHPDSGLWLEMLRVIDEIRPNFAIVENPIGLRDRGLRAVLGGFRMAGYQTEVIVSGAWEIGAPHQRNRIFVLAYSNHLSLPTGVTGSWAEQITQDLKRQGPNWPRPDAKPSRLGLADGFPRWLGGNSPRGWWARNAPPLDPSVAKDRWPAWLRRKAINQYGLAVCPQQARVALRIVKAWHTYTEAIAGRGWLTYQLPES